MVALPENILTSLTNIAHAPRLEQCYLQPLDLAPGETPPWADEGSPATSVGFQYWPESVQDTRMSEWSPRNIPGGSHPIYQWTHGGERVITFTAVFTTDLDPGELSSGPENPLLAPARDAYEVVRSQFLNGFDKTRVIDLRAVVSWLRWFTYPTYDDDGSMRSYEPAKCLVVLPNTKMGYDGSDYLVTVMTQCDVTYEAWFPNGLPRIIEVSLSFAEVVQSGGRVRFHDRKRMSQSSFVAQYLSGREIRSPG